MTCQWILSIWIRAGRLFGCTACQASGDRSNKWLWSRVDRQLTCLLRTVRPTLTCGAAAGRCTRLHIDCWTCICSIHRWSQRIGGTSISLVTCMAKNTEHAARQRGVLPGLNAALPLIWSHSQCWIRYLQQHKCTPTWPAPIYVRCKQESTVYISCRGENGNRLRFLTSSVIIISGCTKYSQVFFSHKLEYTIINYMSFFFTASILYLWSGQKK